MITTPITHSNVDVPCKFVSLFVSHFNFFASSDGHAYFDCCVISCHDSFHFEQHEYVHDCREHDYTLATHAIQSEVKSTLMVLGDRST